ncbi:MAG: phosphotransferase [Thermoleophilaceae bacterium]|nr:phosphotransferase [Thermoleophilaceae bacterium]
MTIPELTEVVARVAALLGAREGGVSLLEGGITNRNYRVCLGGTNYVVRLPGKDTELLGIDRGAECAANKRAAELGIAPPVAAFLEDPSSLVTHFVVGDMMEPAELREAENLGKVAAALREFHGSGAELGVDFDGVATAERYAATVERLGGEPPHGLAEALDRGRAIREAATGLGEHRAVPCHDDLLSYNFLRSGERLLIVDWEYAGMGDRWFDLGNFAAHNDLDDDQEVLFLTKYFGEPPDDARRAWLRLFRWLSDLREAMWALVQAAVSEVDFDFAGYSRRHMERVVAAGPSVEGWLREARVAGP